MKLIILSCAFAVSGCAGRYGVTKSNEIASEMSVPGSGRLVSIREDGSWLWRKTPEDVVKALASLAADEQKQIEELKKKLAAATPAAPDATPAAKDAKK